MNWKKVIGTASTIAVIGQIVAAAAPQYYVPFCGGV